MAGPVFAGDIRPLERVRINFGWLLKLRWAAFGGQLATILLVEFGLGVPLPLYALFAILFFEALSNAALGGWFRGRAAANGDTDPAATVEIGRVLGAVLVLDVVLLTVLLGLTGGTRNPFSVFYLVNIVLSAVVLGPRWTTVVTATALVGYGAVFLFHLELAGISELGAGTGAGLLLDRGEVAAFIAATGVIAVFLTRVTTEVRALEHKLADTERRQARAERMEALGTLAAGAAHELASPLSTIAVVAKDLEGGLAKNGEGGAEDARLIRQEVSRCRAILDQMAVDAGQTTGAELVPATVAELLETTLENLNRADHVRIDAAPEVRARRIVAPLRALALALRQVVKNALDASPPEKAVDIDVFADRAHLVFEVYDRGQGMRPETVARATDPFFTTKEPGQGMGLGLFLAQTVIERLDGRIVFQSDPGLGTTVRIEIPLTRLEPRA